MGRSNVSGNSVPKNESLNVLASNQPTGAEKIEARSRVHGPRSRRVTPGRSEDSRPEQENTKEVSRLSRTSVSVLGRFQKKYLP